MYGACLAQTDQLNLEKYWKFRNSFREKFIKIGSAQGESLPAGALLPYDCQNNIENNSVGYGEMRWGDGMIRHGHYLGLLATEYRLLKNNGQDVTGVLNELYYALNTINRLDKRAESEQDEFYQMSLNENLNGFYLREDVPEDFATTHWGTEALNTRCTNSVFYRNDNAAKLNTGGYINRGNGYQNVPSLDQMSSLMVGLSLVHKLVDDVYIKPKPTDAGFNVVSETKAIVLRMTTYAASHNWFLIDVNGWPVANGGGDISYAAYPLMLASTRILGYTPAIFNTPIVRRNLNYSMVQHCLTGYGSDDGITQLGACSSLGGLEQLTATTLLNDNAHIPGPLNNQDNSVFQSWQLNGAISVPPNVTAPVWQTLAPDVIPEFFDNFLWGNYMKEYNRTIMFNLGTVSGLWNKSRANTWGNFTGNRQLELINAVLNGTLTEYSASSYKAFLDNIPTAGPYNLIAGNWISGIGTTHTDQLYQLNGWAAENKWTNPSAAIGVGGEHGIFSGLDYMLYHNLYRILFQPTLLYEPASNCFCEPAVTKSVGGSQGQIDATTGLNNKLALLETCTPDIFSPISQNVTTTFNIEPKFADYADLKIFTNDFQTNNATITGTGILNIRNRFIICNSKTLTLQSNGKINIEKGELVINPGARLNASGDIRVKSGTSLTIKNTGTLALKAGSKIIIEDNAKLIIDGTLEYYNGAQLITQGNNSEIVMNSLIKIMNSAVFQVDHSADANSGRFIFDGIFTAEQPNTTIILQGKDRYDEFVLLKAGKQLWIQDPEIELFRLDNCKMNIQQGSSLKIEQPFKSSGVDYIATSYNSGITLTEETLLMNCNFTDVSVLAMLYAENKGKLKLISCNFSRANPAWATGATEYVFVNGMGYSAQGCAFTNPQIYGIRSYNLTFPSSVLECTFTQNITNGIGIKDISATELIVKSSVFSSLYRGIYKESGKLSLKCSSFQNNKSDNLNVLAGCLLNMSIDDLAGYNMLYKTTDHKNILLSAAGLNITNGYNYLDDAGQYVLQGSVSSSCTGLCLWSARKNQWNAANAVPAAGKFNVTYSNGTAVSFSAGQVALKPSCGYFDPPPGTENPGNPNGKSLTADADGMPLIQTSSNAPLRLDDAVLYAVGLMELNDSLGNDLEAIEIFGDVFSSGLIKSDSTSRYWLDFSLHHMKSAVENAFSTGKLGKENNVAGFSKHVSKYVHALMYMSDSIIDAYNYVQQFYNEMNKAHLFRLIGHSDIGLNILTGLEACGLDSAEQLYLNYWKTEYAKDLVIAEIGMDAIDTTIVIDTANYNLPVPLVLNEYYFGAQINSLYDIIYPNCEYYTPNKMMKEESKPEFALFPNPADDMVNIVLNHSMTAGNTSTLVFQATDGRVVFKATYTETENSMKTISVSAWKTGFYLYKYTIASGKTYTGKLVVR